MRALERAAGTTLIVRAGRQIRLTEAGEALARQAAVILSTVAVAEEEIAGIAGLQSARVRLIAFPSGSAALVPAAIARVSSLHPGIHVSLSEAEPPEAIAALRAGECDIALTFAYDESPEDSAADLHRLPLLQEPLLAVLPADHRLSQSPWIRLQDLSGDQWIAGCPECRRNLVHVCASVGFEPDIRFATDDNVAAQSLIAAGLGVALMPRMVLTAVQHSGLAVKPVTPTVGRRIIVITWPDPHRIPAVAAMLDALVACTLEHSERYESAARRAVA